MSEHNYLDDQAGQVPEGYTPGSDADIHISSIVFVGVIGSVLIIVIILLLKALYYQTLEAERQLKLGKGIDVALSDLRGKQLEQIGQYRWVNAHAGKVGIPIEDAMQIVWQEQAAGSGAGLEISDWDHNPSDEHAVPGDLFMGNRDDREDNGFGAGIQAVIKAMAEGQAKEDEAHDAGGHH